jgi:hypothetical protein
MATIANQNGHHMVQNVLLPVNIYVHFLIFNDFFNFYIGGHFEMAVILKIIKTKSTLSEDLFLCQILKESAVRFEFN